jgi:hypothetical protein
MVILYKPRTGVSHGSGQMIAGKDTIHQMFVAYAAIGKKFASGRQSHSLINGDLAANVNAYGCW